MKYEIQIITRKQFEAEDAFKKCQEEGWELAGNINVYQGNMGYIQTLVDIPLKRKLK